MQREIILQTDAQPTNILQRKPNTLPDSGKNNLLSLKIWITKYDNQHFPHQMLGCSPTLPFIILHNVMDLKLDRINLFH